MNPSTRYATATLLSLAALAACAGESARHDAESYDDARGAVALGDLAGQGPLRVEFLGVAGFYVEYRGEAFLTAPLYTRPSLFDVFVGLPVRSDPKLVAESLDEAKVKKVRAVVSGHAHYDHLLDVPAVMGLAPAATLFANRSARHLLAAYAPDRPPRCNGTPAQATTIQRSRVVALDDPAASFVDYTNCPDKRPPNAPLEGRWVKVPRAHLRILAVCTEHQDQFGTIHFGPGHVTEDPCAPPTKMADWREGQPLSYLVDFLDPDTDAPTYRVFYQDSPADQPIGHIPPAYLAEKRVDLALLCVGSYDDVDDGSPANMVKALGPRFALGGHWDDFFVSADEKPRPLPFLDPEDWTSKARAAAATLPSPGAPVIYNGQPSGQRVFLPQPGDAFAIAR